MTAHLPRSVKLLVMAAPFGAYLWRRALAEGWIERRHSVPLRLAGFPVQAAVLLALMARGFVL